MAAGRRHWNFFSFRLQDRYGKTHYSVNVHCEWHAFEPVLTCGFGSPVMFSIFPSHSSSSTCRTPYSLHRRHRFRCPKACYTFVCLFSLFLLRGNAINCSIWVGRSDVSHSMVVNGEQNIFAHARMAASWRKIFGACLQARKRTHVCEPITHVVGFVIAANAIRAHQTNSIDARRRPDTRNSCCCCGIQIM